MSDWGRTTYGDPCRECGYSWALSYEDARVIVADAPARFALLLSGVDQTQRHAELGWNAVGYVAHVADNLRIWAERLAGGGDGASVVPYDADALAVARGYDELQAAGVLWSLERAAEDWRVVTDMAAVAGTRLDHPDRGTITVVDVARTNAHDVHHHEWDVARISAAASSPRGWR